MPPLFSLIKEVGTTKREWSLKLRLVRCYQLPAFQENGIFSLECIFHDKEGSRIHGSVKNPEVIERFKPILKETRLFAIKDVLVAENKMKYKTSSSKYRINIVGRTQVCQIFDETFPSHMYEFKAFTDLKNSEEVLDETVLFDVIGKVVARGVPVNKIAAGKPTKLINIVLEDMENNQLSCTLWENFVDEFMTYLEKSNEDDPVVIILQMCRPTRFRGEICVSTSYHITRMLINSKCEEIESFRNRLKSECKTPNTVSTISMPSTHSIIEELATSEVNFRTLEQICENIEVGSFWVLAKIASVETNGEWYYLSCVKCPRKMTPVGDTFYCERCDNFDANGKLRYKIQIRVIDETSNALFLLWDRESVDLIGKTATDLRSQIENKDFKLEEMPKEIEDIVDKRVLFKVQVKPGQTREFNGSYTVMKLTTKSDIVDKYRKEFFISKQEPDFIPKFKGNELGEIQEISSSGDEVTTNMKQNKSKVQSEAMNDPNLKRSLLDEFSSTAADKKMKVVIKQEKD